MKAIQITQPRQIDVINLPKPVPGAGEVLVRICYAGFCGSDLNTWRGANALAKQPVIPGHEVGGVIEAAGPGVPAGLAPGLTVTLNPYSNCGQCASCRRERPNACEHNQTLGVQRDGAMCEYVTLPWEKIIPAGDIPVRDCALIEPMSVGFHAVDRGQVTDTDTVLVIGCGMVGLGAVVRASLRGAHVIAADIDPEKLQLARQLGARNTLNTKEGDVHEELLKLSNGFGPDVVIEAVGSPATYRLAVDEVAFTGRIVCIGYSKADVTFTTRLFVQKELDIRGSRNASPADFRAVISYLESGKCPVDRLITRVFAPEEAASVMQEWDANPGKVFRMVCQLSEG